MMTSLDTRKAADGPGYQVHTDRPPGTNEKKATPMKIKDCDLRAVQGVFVLWGLLWQHIDKEQRISLCSRAGKVKTEEFTFSKGLVAHD